MGEGVVSNVERGECVQFLTPCALYITHDLLPPSPVPFIHHHIQPLFFPQLLTEHPLPHPP